MAEKNVGMMTNAASSGDREKSVKIKIINALSDRRYAARTLSGIAKELRIQPYEIVEAIKKDSELRGVVKVFPMRTRDGKVLLTTKKRFADEASVKQKFVDIFATRRAELDDIR